MLDRYKQLKKGDKIVEVYSCIGVDSTITSDVIVNENNLVEFVTRTDKGTEIKMIIGHPMGPKVYLQSEFYGV